MDWMLSDGEVRDVIKFALIDAQLYGDDGQPLPEKAVAIAQHQRDVKWLKGPCPHRDYGCTPRWKCPACWEEFREG